MRLSMLAAYEWFRRSTLVSIFLAQIFAFYKEEFVALSSLAVAIVYLTALNYAIKQAKRSDQGHVRPRPRRSQWSPQSRDQPFSVTGRGIGATAGRRSRALRVSDFWGGWGIAICGSGNDSG